MLKTRLQWPSRTRRDETGRPYQRTDAGLGATPHFVPVAARTQSPRPSSSSRSLARRPLSRTSQSPPLIGPSQAGRAGVNPGRERPLRGPRRFRIRSGVLPIIPSPLHTTNLFQHDCHPANASVVGHALIMTYYGTTVCSRQCKVTYATADNCRVSRVLRVCRPSGRFILLIGTSFPNRPIEPPEVCHASSCKLLQEMRYSTVDSPGLYQHLNPLAASRPWDPIV